MVYKRSKRKSIKSRRRGRGTRRRRYSRATIGRSRSTLVPDRMFTRLRYSELVGLTYTGVGVSAYYQFRVNSIFDPNLTGIGHQPLGHDEWQLFYNRYRVRGMKYRVTFTNTSATDQVEFALQLRPNSTVDTNFDSIRESPITTARGILGTEGSGQACKSASGYASVAKIRGIPRGRLQYDSDYQAVFGNSPPITPMLNLFVQNQAADTSAVVLARVDLVYLCEFNDRKIQYQS